MIKSKTATSLLLSAALMASTATSALAAPVSFKDVPQSHWAYSSIERAASNKWVSGTGNNKYEPEGKVTEAEWYAMVVRSVYPDKIPAKAKTDQWYSGEWFSPYVEVGKNLGFNYGEVSTNKKAFERPITRTRMAHIVNQVVGNHGLNLTEDQMDATAAKIPDLDPMDLNWAAIVGAYYTGILTGVDEKGTFDGNGLMDRAQAATVLCRLNDWVAKNGKRIRDEIEIYEENLAKQEATQTKPETPAPSQPSVGSSSGVVGTLSDTPVALSYETHKPIVDYWSQTPSAVQEKTDKDMYNALVQSLRDRDIAGENREEVGTGYRNPYYNYAMYKSGTTIGDKDLYKKQSLLGRTFTDIPLVVNTRYKLGQSVPESFWDIKTHPEDFNGYNVYKSYLDKFTPGMSDKEKAEICVKAVTDWFEYDYDAFAGWDDKNRKTRCEGFSMAVSDVLSAAGIPNIENGGNNHTWNYALLDGKWYAIDASRADLYGDKYWISDVEEYENLTLKGLKERSLNHPGSASNIAKTAFEQAYL